MEPSERPHPAAPEVARAWYHGSPRPVDTLAAGSIVTPRRRLAEVYACGPTWVVLTPGGLKHDGREEGWLYELLELLDAGDLEPNPNSAMAPGDEWLTRRLLNVRPVERVAPRPEELLSEAEVDELRNRSDFGPQQA